jgi:hypothetical protein
MPVLMIRMYILTGDMAYAELQESWSEQYEQNRKLEGNYSSESQLL